MKKTLDGLGISISESFAMKAAMKKTIFSRDEELREMTPKANGEIKEVFKEVGDAAKNLLPGCITAMSQVPI